MNQIYISINMLDKSNAPPHLSTKRRNHFLDDLKIYVIFMNIVVSCVFSNPAFSQNNNYELNNAKISAPDFYDTIAGKPVQKSVLLLWIDTGYVNPAAINDTSNIVRPFGDFVTPAFIDSIPTIILKDFVHAEAKKIFLHRTEYDTVSISRTGKRVPIPPFYTALWVRNSSSNLWGQPHQSGSNWLFTPEDSVMLTYFDGYTAKTTGYVYNLGYYAPLDIGETMHIGLSVYGHY